MGSSGDEEVLMVHDLVYLTSVEVVDVTRTEISKHGWLFFFFVVVSHGSRQVVVVIEHVG